MVVSAMLPNTLVALSVFADRRCNSSSAPHGNLGEFKHFHLENPDPEFSLSWNENNLHGMSEKFWFKSLLRTINIWCQIFKLFSLCQFDPLQADD